VRACADWPCTLDQDFDRVCGCAPRAHGRERACGSRLACKRLYRQPAPGRRRHAFELRTPDGDLAAGILGVVLGRAAMLESMRRLRSRAGNALLVRTLDLLAAHGAELCDIQLPTPHTLRLGARLLPRAEYDRRLAAALSPAR
jgi:leucyl/phenylalanyl-tRNA--protein transferase